MDVKTLQRILSPIIESRITPIIWGHHGIGKSSIVKSWCKSLGYAYGDVRVGQAADIGDIIGLPDIERGSDGKATRTSFILPKRIRELVEYCENNPKSKGILFLDEINRAGRKDILQGVFQLVLDNEIAGHKLPENFHCIAAANPDTGNYMVISMDDQALLDRFAHLKFTPSRQDFYDFGKAVGMHTDTVGFLTEQPKFLDTPGLEDFSIKDLAKPSRRSWVAVDKIKQLELPENDFQEASFGLVGIEATLSYLAYIKDNENKLFTPDEILNKLTKIMDRVVKYSDYAEGGRQDILKHSLNDLSEHLKNLDANNGKITKKQVTNICKFLKTVPVELTFDFVSTVITYTNLKMGEHIGKDTELVEKMSKSKKIKKDIEVAQTDATAQ